MVRRDEQAHTMNRPAVKATESAEAATTSAGRKPRREAGTGDAAYLAGLGDRVRSLRTRRGMTRRILAQSSGVSERYLAQLEAGDGNISIILLRQVASAIGVSLVELVSDEPERPVELSLLVRLAERLDAEELGEARNLLLTHFGGEDEAARRRRIALIGLRGAGKSSLGQRLAERRGVAFVELTREIERVAGMGLAEIMGLGGQPMYRRYERRALEAVLQSHQDVVIATGGGLVAEPGNYDLLLAHCFTVWVTATPAEHMSRVIAQGDRRPMADNPEAMEDLKRILEEREPLYAKADCRLNTAGQEIEVSLDALDVLASG